MIECEHGGDPATCPPCNITFRHHSVDWGHPFMARYDGRCAMDCGEWINMGDRVRTSDEGTAHEECVR